MRPSPAEFIVVELTTLETVRLQLRPWSLADVEPVFQRAQDPEFGRFLPLPYTGRHAEVFVAGILLRSWDTYPSFAVTLDADFIGDVGVRVDALHATAEMGWGMAREHWGRGYMTEAARAAMLWAFRTFDIARVLAHCDAGNVASYRVMEKLGMRREGHLRKHRLLRGERRDELIYGILRDEVPELG